MSEYHWIYTTWPDAQAAEAAAQTLIGEKHAACANIFAGATSLYEWEGKVCSEAETIMVLKTSAAALNGLRERLIGLHPYDLPCFIALPITQSASHADYLAWVKAQTSAVSG